MLLNLGLGCRHHIFQIFQVAGQSQEVTLIRGMRAQTKGFSEGSRAGVLIAILRYGTGWVWVNVERCFGRADGRVDDAAAVKSSSQHIQPSASPATYSDMFVVRRRYAMLFSGLQLSGNGVTYGSLGKLRQFISGGSSRGEGYVAHPQYRGSAYHIG